MFTCTVCNKQFDYPEFGPCTKKPGKHVVEPKGYVHGGSAGIQNVRDRRRFSPQVFLRADTERISADGQIVHDSPLVVQFNDARLRTSDPEEQWFLENVAAEKFPIFWGDRAEEVWRANQLNPAQQIELQKAELAVVQRQVKEQNELLAQTKARAGGRIAEVR